MLDIYAFLTYFALVFFLTCFLVIIPGRFNFSSVFDYEKFSAYECGFDPFEHTRFGFDVRYYMVALFYVIFDLEVIFLFPLSLTLDRISFFSFLSCIFFLFLLFCGLLYEYGSGKLDWSLVF